MAATPEQQQSPATEATDCGAPRPPSAVSRRLRQAATRTARRTARAALTLCGLTAFAFAVLCHIHGDSGSIELFGTAGAAWGLAAVLNPRK